MADEHKVLLAGADERDLTQLAEYQAIGGYRGVAKARAMTPDDLIAELSQANLRGRGGAGFPLGRKASLIDRKSPKPKYLVVNADESEPGAFKDREVMARVPHRLLEGCLIAAHAIGQGTVIWVLISEIFPNKHRAEGQALGSFTHWIFAALLTTFFPKMVSVFAPGFVFLFFCFMMVLQLIWVKTMVPETKGVPLEQVQQQLRAA